MSAIQHKGSGWSPTPTDLGGVTLPNRHGYGHLVASHKILMRALTRPGTVTAMLGPGGAHLTSGYGKWEEVAVPRGTPFSQWTGRSLWSMDLDLLFDGWQHGRSQERPIAALEMFALKPAGVQPRGKPLVFPPPVRIWGAVPHPEFTWVITGFDWGDALRGPKTGARLRQAVTVHLLEFVDDSTIAARPSAGSSAGPSPRKYKVQRGDNLHKLAARFLGKSSRWPDIAKLNKGMRGAGLVTWVGKTILIPGS